MGYDDYNEHPHFALWQSENYVSSSEQAWLAWVKQAEQIFGHSLDGDEDEEGYSLDFAHDAFEAGFTPQQYVDEVKANPNYHRREQ